MMLFGGVFQMVYEYVNSKGMKYYLHIREGKGGAKLFFFSKDPTGGIDLPSDMQVVENPRTGLPLVKKK
jgi:hypothetical protein